MNIEKIREALQDAKQRIEDMLSSIDTGIYESELADAESDIDEAIAELDKVQQPAEPVAWMRIHEGKTTVRKSKVYINDIPLYTHQPNVQQLGKLLTDEVTIRIAELTSTDVATQAAVVGAIRHVRDNGYLAPAAIDAKAAK